MAVERRLVGRRPGLRVCVNHDGLTGNLNVEIVKRLADAFNRRDLDAYDGLRYPDSAGPFGCAAPYLGLFLEGHRSRMAGTGPGSEKQKNA